MHENLSGTKRCSASFRGDGSGEICAKSRVFEGLGSPVPGVNFAIYLESFCGQNTRPSLAISIASGTSRMEFSSVGGPKNSKEC